MDHWHEPLAKIIKNTKTEEKTSWKEDIEIPKRNPRLFFEKWKSIKQGYAARSIIMKDNQGNFIINTEDCATIHGIF